MANPFGPGKLSEKDYKFSGFRGLRNTVDVSRFDMGDLDAAINVDLDDKGAPQRRRGFSRAQAGAYHSVGPSGFTRCFVVGGTTLYEILSDLSLVSRVTGLAPNLPLEWFVSGDRYYWSNGVDKGVIDSRGARSWGIDPPPAIAATAAAGSLMVGKSDLVATHYLVSMTYLRKDGQESGAPRATGVDVPDNGGIAFANLPVSSDPDVDRKAIYISEANGEKLFRAAVIPNAQTTLIHRDRGNPSLPLKTQFLRPPPAGTVISLQGGSLLVAVGNRLYYSEPYAFELFDIRKAIPFQTAIQIVCSFDNGTHVATEDMHIWLSGDTPDKYEWNTVATYGAIAGTVDTVDADSSMFGRNDILGPVGIWASREGVVKATPDGKIENLTRDRFLYPPQARGTAVMRIERGVNQFLFVMQGELGEANAEIPLERSMRLVPSTGALNLSGKTPS